MHACQIYMVIYKISEKYQFCASFFYPSKILIPMNFLRLNIETPNTTCEANYV